MAGTRNPWEENYGSNDGQDTGAKPWEQAYQQPEAPKSRTLGAVANDTVIEVANAAAGGVSSAANFIKPGNAVSGWIDKNIVKAGEDSQSDVTKAAKQQFRDEVENADGVMGELGAVGKYVVQNPLLSAAQAAGSFVGPGLAVKAAGFAGKAAQLGAKGVERAGRAGGVAAGAAMAGGDAAGTAYELSRKAGATEDQAVDAGRQASVIPAIVGGVSGMFGAERLLAGAKGFSGGAASRALKTGASEAAQEGFEEGVTQYEGQRAAMPYDASIDPSKGVAAAAGMGAALGGITGAGTSLLTGGNAAQPGPSQQTPPPAPANSPATGPTLALPAPDPGVIAVGGDGTARTPAYQPPGYVGDVTDVVPKAPRAPATDFASILDTDSVYSGWSNVQDGSDRATMRDQMAYVGRAYGGNTTPENAAEVAADLSQQFKWFRAASPDQKQAAINSLMTPAVPADPVRAAVESAANSGGALSPAALVAIDSGVTPRQESAFKDVPELGAQPPQVNLDDIADPYDRAYYESLFDDDPAPLGAPPVLSAFLQNDDDIPDFDAANNVSEEDFLRALGADEQEIQDAIATTPNRAESAPEGAALPAGPQANVTAGTPEGAGAGAAQPAGPVTDAPTNLRDALARVRAQKQEAANAQAAQAPASAAAPAPGPTTAAAVEANGVAPQASIQAITAKQIPDMTDAELQAAIVHYGPAHKRTAKLQAALDKRQGSVGSVRAHSVGSQSIGLEHADNSAAADAERVANFSGAKAGSKQLLNRLDADDLASMERHVLRVAQHPEIFNAVVKLIPVNVMNMLRRQQLTPEILFGNPTMLTNGLVGGNSDHPVTIPVDAATAVMRAVASVTAKDLAIFEGGNSRRLPIDAGATSGTRKVGASLGGIVYAGASDSAVPGAALSAAKDVGSPVDQRRVPDNGGSASGTSNSNFSSHVSDLNIAQAKKQQKLPEGDNLGTTSYQTQQAAAQPAQAGPAQPAQGLTDAAAAQNPGAQGTPAPGAQAQTQGAAWDGLDPQQRTAVLSKAGWITNKGGLNVIGKRLLNTSWEQITGGTREIIARNIENEQGVAATAGVQEPPSRTPESASTAPTLQSAMDAAGWTGETGKDDTIWTKEANSDTYTARLTGNSLEVTVPVNGVGTQIASITVTDPTAAAKAASKAVADDVAESAPAPSPGVVNIQPVVSEALENDLRKQKARAARLRTAAAADGMSLDDKKAAQLKATAAEATLRAMRTKIFDAEDAVVASVKAGNPGPFSDYADLFPGAEQALVRQLLATAEEPIDVQQAVRGAVTAQKLSKADTDAAAEILKDKEPPASAQKPVAKKPSADQTRAKADLMNALADLGDILGKNTRMNIMPEQEQKLLPVLTRVLDAAFRLGYHKFKDSAKFALDQIRTHLGDEAADALTLDHLQGAYIAMAGGKQGADTKRAVIDVETKAEIESHAAASVDDTQDAADNETQEVPQDERTTVQGDGPQALDGVVAGAGEGTQGDRSTGADATGGRDQRPAPGAGADGAGVQGPRSGGGRAERVHSAETGNGGRVRKPGRVKKLPEQAAAEQAVGPDKRPAVAGQPTSTPNIPAADFQISDETRLGQGGEVAKFNDNLAAIRVLKTIEQENRRATPEEQSVLARYVGWGGLANAFPDPLTGAFKPAWEARGKELRTLLEDAEFSAVRRSTRNAHYTSKTVVDAMWSAVARLGFKGGLALETSMGVGNFLGLKPQGIPANFIGVEYDSLTARIAQALYPQATVLHSGFQSVPLPDNAFALSIGNPPFGSESLRFQYKPELNGTSIHNQFFRASMDALRPGGIQAMVVSRFLMDAKDKSTRLALAKQAKLVAAIRLPDTAFKENARTDVVTDIIILQKLTPAEQQEMDFAAQAYQQRPEKGATAEAERQALAAKVPAWVETVEIPDPLGGEAMTVNAYFRDNPANIMGVLERSGSMQHGADITVRLDVAANLERLLTEAVDRLPQGIQDFGAEVLAATEQRHKSMSDALRISLAGQEVGHVQLNRDGVLERVVERETPEGGIEMGMQAITAESPWSDQLMQDAQGRWYRNEVVMDEAGKPVKAVNPSGKVTRNNLVQRVTYATDAEVPDSLRLGKTGYERLMAAVGLRDSLKRQIMLETADAAKGVMDANRKELAKRYEAFVVKFGPVNRPANLNLLMTMPDGGLTAALEVSYQAEVTAARAKTSGLAVSPEVAKPAPILTERVVPKYEPATSAGTASDALAITLSERGRVDLDRIAQLRGVNVEEAGAELQAGEKPLIFKDPETQEWETADAYLSGNVRRKLNAARAARMDTNIRALEAVQPAPWGAEDVTVMLGATWVPTKVYADFAEHLTGGKAKVSFSPATNAFSLNVNGSGPAAKDWSSEGAPADYILSRLLNSQAVVVTYKDENGSVKRDLEASTLAQLKAKEISAEFLDWVFKDSERRAALVELFNEKYNTRVVRQRDGSHLALPGKVPDTIIGMRRHQKNVIWRGITDNALLMDHAVGAGKTFAAIARAMERRRMGLSKKPMIVVPNHLIDQWSSDVYRLYPGAKVLAAGKKDFEAKRRRRLFGKIATGDWDIVLVPHSSFGFIGIDPSTEARYLKIEMDQALQAVKDAADQAAEDGTDGGRRKPFGVKEAERLVEKIQARMDRLNSGTKDRLLTFEQLGVDDLTIDEAHEFKNLYYSSRMTGVRGMGDKTGSRKANDLYNKVRVLQENPSNSVSFLTGTPISNSAVEMFTVMRYLAPKQLKDMGLDHFDAWRAQFVEATAAFEPTESNSLKEVTRLGRNWSNMRSLMDLYYEFTDAVSLEDIQRWYSEDNGGKPFPVPKVKGGDRQLVNVQPTPAQEAMLRDVIAGFDGLESIEDPYERNAERLRLMDRARKVSLDVRAVAPRHPSTEPGGKLEQASQNIKRIYDRWSADRGTQMVFLDRSVPRARGDDKIIREYDALLAKRDDALAKEDEAAFQAVQESLDRYDPNEIAELRNAQGGGWNAYQQIKDNLIAMGVPANEIRFIQEANNDEQKQALFDAVNSGKVRVLLGSSQRMGAGTNAQKRLVGLHHIDVTWKPSDIEQREGRIIRQGNDLLAQYGESFEVEILAYATERTVDAKMWDLNATKLKMINGIRKYDGAFSMEFEDADSVSMAEMAALASGNPLLLERVKTESEINMLELQERAFRRRMYGAEDAVRSAETTIERNPGRIKETQAREAMARNAIQAAGMRQEARRVTVEGKEYDGLQGAMGAVKAAIEAQQGDKPNARYSLMVDGQRLTNREAIDAAIGAALGDAELFEATINGKAITQHTVAARELVAELNGLTAGISAGDSRSKTVGTMLGMSLAIDVTAYDTGNGGSQIDASVSLVDDAGATVSSMSITPVAVNQSYVTANLRNPVSELFNSVGKMASRSDAEYLQRQLDRAIKDLPGLRERLGQTFPKGEELASKRARLRELISLLDGNGAQSRPAPAAPDAGAMYRAPDSDAPERTLSLDRVNQLVQEALSGIRGAPPVEVTARPGDIGLRVPAGSVGYGVTLRSGDIYVFQSAMGSDLDVFKTVFHELFHRGVRVLVPKAQYVQTMLDLAKGDSRIQQLAIEWKNTEMGQKQKDNLREQGYTGAELTGQYEALAVEEALAAVAEEIKAQGKLGSKPKSMTIRFLANWLAKLADMAGMKKLAQGIRAMTYNQAERFVMSAIDRLGEPVQAGRTDNMSAKQATPGTDQTQTEAAFSRGTNEAMTNNDVVGNQGGRSADDTTPGDLLRKLEGTQVVDPNGAPLLVYHGSKSQIDRFDASKTIDGGLHFGSKSQASMRSSKILHPAYLYAENLRRSKDTGSNWKAKIASAKAAGYDGIVYLNRYEGVSKETVFRLHSQGLSEKLDRMSDAEFRRAVPEAEDSYIVFDAKQVIQQNESSAPDSGGAAFSRTAIGNNGDFDPANADIRFRSADMGSRAGMASKARDELNRTFAAPGKLSWWHKTVGTMYNLAERSPVFKRVFDSAQGFVDDVSHYATDAAELAPKLLPKLETWRDIAKRPISAADNAAVAKPVFEGTLDWARDEAGKPVRLQVLLDAAEKLTPEQKAQRLLRQNKISEGMLKAWQGLPLEQYEKLVASRYESQMLKAGIVWTPAELKSQFKLNDAQVALYQEFRAATDRSLDTMARSDMLRFGGEDVKDLADMVMDAASAQDAAQILRDHLLMLAKENPDRAGAIGQLANGMLDRAARVQELQEQGYAPLSRFGKYTVDVVDAGGERQYFGLFETAREANIMAMKMRKGFGQDAVTQGTLSDEEFKLLAGITPESLELFGNMLGLDATGDDAQDQAFQEYLRRTKTNRSAMRRLIHRQGIAGYSEDVGRVLASFIYSNARQTSAGLHMGDLGEAITAIPKQQGELKDAAIQLSEYVKNPQEEAQMVRGLLFAQYLGGSIASAVVNMTQPVAVSFPWLSQFGGAKQAATELGRAAKNLASRGHRYEADLAAALKLAEEEGTVSPQEVHQLMAQARGSGSLRPGDGTRAGDARAAAGNVLTRLSLGWGKVFGAAEQVNRRMTFIAAYRVAKAQGMANPAAFAKKAVVETQFVYSKANKMKWGRGAVGATVMTFKTYSIAYIELLHRMYTQGGPEGKQAVLLALAVLMLMGGAGGLPFAEDAEDLVDGLAQMMGYNFNSKKAKQELLESVFGEAGAGFVERGITGLPGMPLDVSGRLGMGNLLPGTGIFKEKTDHTRDVLELVGPVGDLAKRVASGGRAILTGDVGAGLLQVSPVAVRNAAKGADMAARGMYRDDKGYKVIDTTPTEAAMKAIGFQPASVAKVQEANFINQQAKNFYSMQANEIRALWARGIFEQNQDLVEDARARVEDWNRKNPDQRMVIAMPAVFKRVREMFKTKDQRIADTAPKAMRQALREESARARAAQ